MTRVVPSLNCLRDQPDASGEHWREAEAAVFVLLEHLRRGYRPSEKTAYSLPEAARRRLGYLCDLCCLHLNPDDPAGLGVLAEGLRASLSEDPLPITSAVAAVPGSHRRGLTMAFDMAGGWWGVYPPLDIQRFRAEVPALVLGDDE